MNDMEQMLIQRYKKGDINAFEILISGYDKKIYNIAFGLVGNEEDAKDIAQDALIKAFINIKYFRGESSFSTWIYRIVMNTGKDFLRRRRQELSFEESHSKKEMKDENPGPLETLENRESSDEIHQILLHLKEEYRSVIILKDLHGFSYQEIADILDIQLGTVKSRISRGRYILRSIFKQTKEFKEY